MLVPPCSVFLSSFLLSFLPSFLTSFLPSFLPFCLSVNWYICISSSLLFHSFLSFCLSSLLAACSLACFLSAFSTFFVFVSKTIHIFRSSIVHPSLLLVTLSSTAQIQLRSPRIDFPSAENESSRTSFLHSDPQNASHSKTYGKLRRQKPRRWRRR